MKTQAIVRELSFRYWKDAVTFRYKLNFYQPVLPSIWKIIWKTQKEKCTYTIFTLIVLRRIIHIIFDSAVQIASWISRRTIKRTKMNKIYSTAERRRQSWSIKFDTIRFKGRYSWRSRKWKVWWEKEWVDKMVQSNLSDVLQTWKTNQTFHCNKIIFWSIFA